MVMGEAIAHPADSRLLEHGREHLVKAAQERSLTLHQIYPRGPTPCAAGRLPFPCVPVKRIKRVPRTLRTRVDRTQRDIERQLDKVSKSARSKLLELLGHTQRIRTQKPKDKTKLYALHAPEVECVSKDKARRPYAFGVKVSIMTTLKEWLVLVAHSMPGNPYDGHTLYEALEQAATVSEI